jgi:putative transposase
VNTDDLPQRRHPIHLAARERGGQAVLCFITVCTRDRKPLLANPQVHALLREIWSQQMTFLVGRYVLMPDHLHLFCAPATFPAEPLDRWMVFWKTQSSLRWPTRVTGKIWQRDFWDTELRHSESYASKWEYVRQNPVRAGLASRAEDWSYQGEIGSLHDSG